MRRRQLDNLEEGFNELSKGISETNASYEANRRQRDEPRFAVLKERSHIYRRLERMAEEAEERLVLLLGRYGILHLCRSEALETVNSVAEKGVVVQVIAQLDRRTTRFFQKLHESIEIKHSDDLDSQGFLQDCTHVVQFLNIEENPVGRGKEDAALVIESEPFAKAQENLIDTIWEDAFSSKSLKLVSPRDEFMTRYDSPLAKGRSSIPLLAHSALMTYQSMIHRSTLKHSLLRELKSIKHARNSPKDASRTSRFSESICLACFDKSAIVSGTNLLFPPFD